MAFDYDGPRHRRRSNVISLHSQPKMVQAILKGDIQSVKELIARGEDVNETDSAKRSYLHLASAIGATEIVKLLIAAGALVNAKDKLQLTPMHRACRENHDRAVEVLLEASADVNARGVDCVSPLHVCAANNALECARLIQAKVSNIDASDRSGASALHHASYNGSCDIVTFLLKTGASPNIFDKRERRPLHWAAARDNTDAIRLLLEAGANINARDVELRTPLHYAAACGFVNAVQSLIEYEADVTAVDKELNTALHLACLNGQDDVIDEILGAGGDEILNAPNAMGLTALHYAAASNMGTSCLEALIAYQGPALDPEVSDGSLDYEAPKLIVDARDNHGRTPLHLAARNGRLSRVQELLRVGAEPNATDRSMMSALHYAVRSGNTGIIEVLMSHPNIEINAMDSAGMTPLHHAAFFGITAAVGTLMKSWSEVSKHNVRKAANPLIHDITGRFPHFLAAYAGNVECLKMLFPVDYGHYLTGLDNFDRSPLHYAAAVENDHQCLQYLLELRKPRHYEENGCLIENGDAVSDEPLFNVNQSDIFGRTPLHYAAGADAEGRSVKLLLKAGARMDLPDAAGYYTLNYAATAGKLGALETLLNYSKFAWHRIRFTQCPTHAAAFHGHVECLELLLSAGLYSDLKQSLEYSKERDHVGAYQAINYYISTNDSSLYFSATEDSFNLSHESLRASFGKLGLVAATSTGEDDDDNDLNSYSAVNSSNDLVSSVVKANGSVCGTPPKVAEQLNA